MVLWGPAMRGLIGLEGDRNGGSSSGWRRSCWAALKEISWRAKKRKTMFDLTIGIEKKILHALQLIHINANSKCTTVTFFLYYLLYLNYFTGIHFCMYFNLSVLFNLSTEFNFHVPYALTSNWFTCKIYLYDRIYL